MSAGINPADMCEMKPISFKASDGLLINGYLTVPKNGGTENLPVVVMPHTDPWNRNNWGYNSDVQFLASRGYAVFQVNYRGSTGYGKAFMEAGFKQIGGRIQQDITDGVHWLIDQKIANPKKIAIFGTGFGGFSALNGVSSNPGLYACAAVQYPLINFFTFFKDVPPFLKPKLNMMYEMMGSPENDADKFKAISPIFNTGKVKVPLLVVQGPRYMDADILELNHFVSDVKKNGIAVTYVLKDTTKKNGPHIHKGNKENKSGGKHNNPFPRESNRISVTTYTNLEKFLETNLGKK